MGAIEDLERRIRERDVRVEERLALLAVLQGAEPAKELEARQREIADTVRRAADKLKGLGS